MDRGRVFFLISPLGSALTGRLFYATAYGLSTNQEENRGQTRVGNKTNLCSLRHALL